MSNYFYPDGAPKKCPCCEGDEIREDVKTVDDGEASEYMALCAACGEVLGFFAYGHWDPEFREMVEEAGEL